MQNSDQGDKDFFILSMVLLIDLELDHLSWNSHHFLSRILKFLFS